MNRLPTGWKWTRLLPLVLLLVRIPVSAQSTDDSFLEFGTVIEIGRTTLRLRIPDPRTGRPEDRTFALGSGTEADLVRAGDTVEVIYKAGPGNPIERLIALHGKVPRLGPAPAVADAVAPGPPAPSRTAVSKHHTRPTPSHSVAKTVPAPATCAAPANASVPATQPVALGNPATARVPQVNSVGLGGASSGVNPTVPRATAVPHQTPGALCDRRADWGTRPITLAVLDFRYPTGREEAHDLAQVGGGSGTALADQVYNLLGTDQALALSRGDRDKLFRMDFAGAARLGRQIGVDAVLLGTFVPVDQPNPDPDFPQPTQAYTLRAGVVETCTGELLYKLDSLTCGPGSTGPTCPGSMVTAREAADPDGHAADFREPLRQLLAPLTSRESPAGNAGTVTAVRDGSVTLRLAPGVQVRPGEQLGIHATRLAKIASTNTLHVFRDELIGRVTVTQSNGREAQGTFAGEPAPLPGDAADLISQ